MLTRELVQDFEYRNPESFYDPDDLLIANAKNDDVLGLKAKLEELEDLIKALQLDEYAIADAVAVAEGIFNQDCGSKSKNKTTIVEGEIVVRKVDGDIKDLEKRIQGIESLVSNLKAWERVEDTESNVTAVEYEKVLNILERLSRRNPNDYDYSSIEIGGDNKKAIAEFEGEIDHIKDYLMRLLSSKKDYRLALLLVRLRSQLQTGCNHSNSMNYITENSLTVSQVVGDFSGVTESIKGVFNSLVKWKIDTFGKEDTDPDIDNQKTGNPAPTPLKDRPPILFYYAMSTGNGKYCSYDGCTVGFEQSRSFQWSTASILDLNPNDRVYHPYNYCYVFTQPGNGTATVLPRGSYGGRGYNNLGLHTSIGINSTSNNRFTKIPFDFVGVQFSTGRNAFSFYRHGKVKTSFNPYGKVNKIEETEEKGLFKVTFTGCNFPGICLVQPATIGSSNSHQGIIANVQKLELVNGDAIAYIKFYTRSTYGSANLIPRKPEAFYVAYLGSHHAISDAIPGGKVSLYSNAWDEPFVSTNLEDSQEIIVTPPNTDDFARVEFKHHDKDKGYTLLQIHSDPTEPQLIPYLSLVEVTSNYIVYDAFDLVTNKAIKKQLPISVLSFQI